MEHHEIRGAGRDSESQRRVKDAFGTAEVCLAYLCLFFRICCSQVEKRAEWINVGLRERCGREAKTRSITVHWQRRIN